MKHSFFLAFCSLCFLSACALGPDYSRLGDGIFARVETPHGEFFIKLEDEKAPLSVANFIGLTDGTIDNKIKGPGEPYFDGMTFHRVEPNILIQGGDPLANGLGGPGYKFSQEIHPDLNHNESGTVAMANAGPGTNGSQWYVTMIPLPQLNGSYNIFGFVVEGLDIVKKIQRNDPMIKVEIIRNGEAAQNFDETKVFIKHP